MIGLNACVYKVCAVLQYPDAMCSNQELIGTSYSGADKLIDVVCNQKNIST